MAGLRVDASIRQAGYEDVLDEVIDSKKDVRVT